jgi:hypothetical protein
MTDTPYLNTSDYIRDSQAGDFQLSDSDRIFVKAKRPVLKLRGNGREWAVYANSIEIKKGTLNECIGEIRAWL